MSWKFGLSNDFAGSILSAMDELRPKLGSQVALTIRDSVDAASWSMSRLKYRNAGSCLGKR
jgi:hypothetical protein